MISAQVCKFSSVAQSCPTLCDPMNRSTPGLPVHHQLLEFTPTYVHQVGDAIQPSHPLLSPSPSRLQSFPASGSFPMSQFFASGGQSIGASALAPVLPTNIQDWSPLGWTGWIPLQSKGLSRVFSNTTVQKHQFFGAQLTLWSNSHIDTWPLDTPELWLRVMFSRLIHVVVCIRSSSFFNHWIILPFLSTFGKILSFCLFVSAFGLLGIMLLGRFIHRFLCGHMFSFPVDI